MTPEQVFKEDFLGILRLFNDFSDNSWSDRGLREHSFSMLRDYAQMFSAKYHVELLVMDNLYGNPTILLRVGEAKEICSAMLRRVPNIEKIIIKNTAKTVMEGTNLLERFDQRLPTLADSDFIVVFFDEKTTKHSVHIRCTGKGVDIVLGDNALIPHQSEFQLCRYYCLREVVEDVDLKPYQKMYSGPIKTEPMSTHRFPGSSAGNFFG